jgi:hypothetical protein
MTITTLRPSSTSSGIGWSAVPSGTLQNVTSDDNDGSYALWSGSGAAMILGTVTSSPPAGQLRHQVRMRARGQSGDAWWAVRLASGALAAGASASFTGSPTTVNGSWGFGAPLDGPTALQCYVTGQSASVRIVELYLDIDTRSAPSFTAQTLNAAGTSTTTISDTSQPIVRASAINLDGLNARQYRYWVTLNGAIVWDTGVTSGPAVNRTTSPLVNGSYVAHLQVWSTVGQNTAYPSAETTLAFTVSVGTVNAPAAPTVTPVPDSPMYEIQACAPTVTGLDGGVGFIEVQRVDCAVGGWLDLPGSAGAYASTPDTATALTDLQVTVFAQRDDDWRPAADQTLAAQYNNSSNQRSWRLTLDALGNNDQNLVGRPVLVWSVDGTSGTNVIAACTERVRPDPTGRVWLRVTLDVNDGAGGWTVLFEYRETEDDPWQQLGNLVTNSGGGITSLFNSTAPYTVGAWLAPAANEIFQGRFYSLEVRNGPAGAVIVNPDFTDHLSGTTSFTDMAGNTWTINSPASIYNPVSPVTVTILGPLATGACATATDWNMPRQGVGGSCTHTPEECCSYYRVRTVGRISGSLRVSAWTNSADAYCLYWDDDQHLIRSAAPGEVLWVPILGKFAWDRDRPFTAATGVDGGRFVTSAPPGGRNLSMSAAVESEEDWLALHEILGRPLVLVSPSDAEQVWAAPVAESMRVVKVGRIRSVTAAFIGTGPQPAPQLSDVG